VGSAAGGGGERRERLARDVDGRVASRGERASSREGESEKVCEHI